MLWQPLTSPIRVAPCLILGAPAVHPLDSIGTMSPVPDKCQSMRAPECGTLTSPDTSSRNQLQAVISLMGSLWILWWSKHMLLAVLCSVWFVQLFF